MKPASARAGRVISLRVWQASGRLCLASLRTQDTKHIDLDLCACAIGEGDVHRMEADIQSQLIRAISEGQSRDISGHRDVHVLSRQALAQLDGNVAIGEDRILAIADVEQNCGAPVSANHIVAGIALAYSPEQLVGRKVIVVCNLEPRKLRGVESNGMIVAASAGPDGQPIIAGFLEDVPVGSRLK